MYFILLDSKQYSNTSMGWRQVGPTKKFFIKGILCTSLCRWLRVGDLGHDRPIWMWWKYQMVEICFKAIKKDGWSILGWHRGYTANLDMWCIIYKKAVYTIVPEI